MKRLACAAIDYDDNLHEIANANVERGITPGRQKKSDDKDDKTQNKVIYSNSRACDSELDCEDEND